MNNKADANNTKSNAQSLLVVGPAWVGDMVMAQSLFKALKRRHANDNIDVLAPAWSAPILARMPEVRRAVVQPIGHGKFGLLARWRLARQLKSEGYHAAYVIPRSLKAALIPFFAAIPKRIGYKGEFRYGLLNDIRRLDKKRLPQTVQRYVALAELYESDKVVATPHPQLDINPDNRDALIERLQLNLERPVIALMPGAEYGPSKQWPLSFYRELAQRCIERGRVVWVMGSEKDRAAGEEICTGLESEFAHNLCGKTRLEDAIDLLSCAAAAVSNDSGLMHVAAAVNRPLLAIYGSSTPAYTPPLSNRASVLYRGLECSPCFDRSCRFGHNNCMRLISSNDALLKLEELLEKYKGSETKVAGSKSSKEL